MTSTIKTLASYLGKPASVMLVAPPFVSWVSEKSVNDDEEGYSVDYFFPQNGLEVRCDGDERIKTIFLSSDGCRFVDISPSSTRLDIMERFGPPSKSGIGVNDPVLGEYGPWDRFKKVDHTIHAEYRVGSNRIRMITLMRPDVVP
jgi:hypothetical protein